MSAVAEAIPQATGDWHLRSIRDRGLDLLFAVDRLSDTALSAACMASRRFDARFPGWELYRTVVNGGDLYRPGLNAYAIGLGRTLAEAHTYSGRVLVKYPGPWVSLAALDAMERCISGSFPAPAVVRARMAGVSDKTYSRLRDILAGGFLSGFEAFRAELHACVIRVIHMDAAQLRVV